MSNLGVCFVHGDALDLFRGENGPRFGGSETQIYLMARTLADAGEFDIRLVADKDVTGAAYPGISFHLPPPLIRRGLPYVSRFINLKRLREPYEGLDDAILLQTVLCDYTIPTWQAARRLGFKFVYRMSCDADIDGSLWPPERAAEFHAALRDADGIIAQTEEQQRRLRDELGVASTVVPSIVELPEEGPALTGDKVLWVGRGAPIKRPWIMAEAARRLPDIDFVVLMPVENKLFWRCIVQEMERIPNLTVVPGVSYFEMARYYREASVVVQTSAIEGVPNVFLQAAAQGKPVISFEVDPDGMLGREGIGRSTGGDVDAFHKAIAEYVEDADLRAKQGLAGFEYVRRTHSPEAVRPVLTEFLRGVFAGR